MAATQKPLSFSLCPENIEYVLDVVAKQKLTNRRYNRSTYMDDLITHLRTKAKPKKKSKNQLVASEVDNLNIKAWDKWVAYRKKAKIKAYTTDLKMKELATLGTFEEQAQIVFNSISNQYSGLFALKGNNNGHQKTSKKLSAHERQLERNSKYRSNECGLAVGADDGHLGRTVDEGEGRGSIIEMDTGTFVDYE